MNDIRNPRVQTHSTYLFLKLLALLWCECVCFGNKWNDIHFFMQTLHKLNIQWFKSEIHNMTGLISLGEEILHIPTLNYIHWNYFTYSSETLPEGVLGQQQLGRTGFQEALE